MESPLFSFVATSRNDDHGGDVLRRTQSFVLYLATQAERHCLRTELVLVDWNPPGTRAPLVDVLDWPEGSEFFSAKVITVPHAVHLGLKNGRSFSMFQMIAKNAGLRRASGEYVIATNIDIIFSDELIRWLKATELDENTLYRSDRWDIPNEIQLDPDFTRLLQRAREGAIRKNLADGVHTRTTVGWCPPERYRVDFLLLDRLAGAIQHVRGLQAQGKDVAAELTWLIDVVLPEGRANYTTPDLHIHGCGDFTMMAKSAWARTRGYPEWCLFSWNIDSVTLYHATYLGMDHINLPSRAVHYHIEHDNGSGWTPGNEASLWSRLEYRGIPYISGGDLGTLIAEMRADAEAGSEPVFNDADWGFAQLDLPTIIAAEPGMPAKPRSASNSGPLKESFDSNSLVSSPIIGLPSITNELPVVEVGWRHGWPTFRMKGADSSAWRATWPIASPHGQPFWVVFDCLVIEGNANMTLRTTGGETLSQVVKASKMTSHNEIILVAVPTNSGVILEISSDSGQFTHIETARLKLFHATEEQADGIAT